MPDIVRILESSDPAFGQQSPDTLGGDSMEIGNVLNRETCQLITHRHTSNPLKSCATEQKNVNPEWKRV